VEVIPAIDLRAGRCVRLLQGDYDRETVFGEDPVAVAEHWESLGATRLHIVDLDGARTGAPAEMPTIERIAARVSIPVQVAGGLRTLEHANHYLRAGADRIVFGTAAVKDPRLIVEALAMDKGAVVVALDTRGGKIRTEGWIEESDLDLLDLAGTMEALGVGRVLFTEISRDGMLTEPDYAGLSALRKATRMAVIASGGISSVAQLRRVSALGVEAAIVGRALYTGAIDLREALVAIAGESRVGDAPH
jgi:phosphoribosylformimino-5-aminoimidazole carboxamide ribotide isomerase